MKKWTNPELTSLSIDETAYGKNYNAKEANANKHPNNGAGGSLVVIPEGDKSDDETTVVNQNSGL